MNKRTKRQLGNAGDRKRRKDRLPKPAVTEEVGAFREDGDAAELTEQWYQDVKPTLADTLKRAKVDTAVWEPERFVVNHWDVGMKLSGGKGAPDVVTTRTLWQVKVWLRRKVTLSLEEVKTGLIREMKKASPRVPKLRYPKPPRGQRLMLEVNIPDWHFSQLSWQAETGADYDSEIAEQLYRGAVERLAALGGRDTLQLITLVVGNDMFHVDNPVNATTRGTRQDTDTRWQRSFQRVHHIVIDVACDLRRIAPVRIVVVPGNHDEQRAFYLGEVLAAWFHNDKNVAVDNEPTIRKYLRWGSVLLGLTHGCHADYQKEDALPGLMAAEVPEMWAATRHREWHVGHRHTKAEKRFLSTQVRDGVVVRTLPALAAATAWVKKKGYLGPRAAEAYLWDAERGYVAHFSANVLDGRTVA